jgi:GTPase SAR1 family protein
MITIKENKKPNLKISPMICDKCLADKLNKYELTSLINKHTCNAFIGNPGSGKTTFLNSLFQSNRLLKKVYHDIYLFQPSHSRTSQTEDIWEKGIRDENKFDELNNDTLMMVREKIKSQDKDVNSCIIFDDVGSFLQQNKEIITLLKDIMANHRHYGVSMFFLCQTIKMIPFELRRMMDNLFVFKSSRESLESIFEEYLGEYNKRDLITKITKLVYDKPHQFLFINTASQRIFKQFDEILIE